MAWIVEATTQSLFVFGDGSTSKSHRGQERGESKSLTSRWHSVLPALQATQLEYLFSTCIQFSVWRVCTIYNVFRNLTAQDVLNKPECLLRNKNTKFKSLTAFQRSAKDKQASKQANKQQLPQQQPHQELQQ
ncbi:hypothetical protein PHYBLDRAFT_60295 [Phycomyces blakesleeanus NRRL 1555(-)]|uniref:Uncharacterized protein n=1 Tax=Phycomyces blakesleeanus (strain ATCC 8743b / DSM 1359 / FGSC 10004 / NBRC 33097 / NRRL 1555) TaxID=763407 RepID=A0A167LAB5_PHYB8|nr:hypothetical protein PHYBLDRAFT_60295 [Phycomyces blakesleeanus NRRL 1555(-)]OAD69969.1 hypothetical protein PHYBLDRAFT_60295 [Phycomyces blakesleeanus NRRL 1555(-)]|eukprot:XP_018288009.1 hypothetical protein PHYBLDRAFT_60295 [Phycomyces blakesleeanus NRRL 1555(-)]